MLGYNEPHEGIRAAAGVDLDLAKNSPLLRQGQFIKIFEEGSIIKTDFK